jgi:hypothetical protein
MEIIAVSQGGGNKWRLYGTFAIDIAKHRGGDVDCEDIIAIRN